ncbi:MAG: hypothetical protein J6Y91_04650 [Alphaproteobacteria bacterium]|nr:hypothetical protein [Alphaproteobacteria bacterium]
MAQDIMLKIYTPERTFFNRAVHRVVLPYGRLNLTAMIDRAPLSLALPTGRIDILDAANNIESSYFVDGGVVDFAENVCKISTRHIIKTTAITLAQAQEKLQEEPQNADFYKMIITEISGAEPSPDAAD